MKKIYLVGNAHLDPVWLWQYQEGLAEVKATFRSALDRMKEFDYFKFTSACGAYYMWIEKSDPEMFKEIQARVKEGRWILAGGWFIQPDCNVPSGESFARHTLITQRYFLKKFGRTAKTGYNVDSFGHNGTIPQILRHGRMENYVFMRPMSYEKEIPQSLFMWESKDGSRVKTYRISLCYDIGVPCHPISFFDDIKAISEKENSDEMAFYGIGNHGGGPTVELLNAMREKLDDDYIYSSPDEFFDAQSEVGLPILKEDLQYHAKGCYSSVSFIKQGNRYSENKLISAEKLSCLSKELINTEYPSNDLAYAWHRVLFNQFHDIMGGCSIREALDDARNNYGEVISIADRTANFARQQISWNIDTLRGFNEASYVSKENAEKLGMPFVVFNPLDHEVSAPIYVTKKAGRITDEDGNELAIQHVRASRTNSTDKYDTLFEAKVGALGYRVYRVFMTPADTAPSPFTTTENSIANGKLKLTFDKESGELCSIIRNGKELLEAPCEIALYDDEKNDMWAHGTEFFKDRVPAGVSGSVKLIEEGPVRATIRSTQNFNDSVIVRDYSITPDSDRIDVKVKIDNREKFRVLKFLFPAKLNTPKAYGKIPFGYIERSTDGREYPCGDWIALCDENGGIGIANDSKYSFEADKNTLSLTIFRSALFADHYGERDEFCEFSEQGEHFFKYSIFPFTSFADAQRNADELQYTLCGVPETFHKGSLPTSYSGLWVSAQNINITAIKKHEDGDGYVLRLYESDGKDTHAQIKLFDTEFECFVPHNAIRTYLIKNGKATEVDFLE